MLAGWVRQGSLRYRQTQKSLEWFQSIGLQLPKEGTAQGSIPIVLTETSVIKAGINQLGGSGYGCRTKTKAHSRRGGPLTVFAELEAAQQRDVSPRWLPPSRAGNGMPISAFPKLRPVIPAQLMALRKAQKNGPTLIGMGPAPQFVGVGGMHSTQDLAAPRCPPHGYAAGTEESIAHLTLFRNPAARHAAWPGPHHGALGAQAVRWHCRRASGPLRGA